ncbi:hypothetical protein TREMEDRAFT_65902 [Tremella mesenterica DSM 1558]|uniref:uncharacterized protein n=1 Tax=Tremella mesenterica (strain ATCC 24925 / CBS 8224 / DSM 1558 / NBRC 9311 / NRRL Y-6157 / RJB 2259-6 / UBC 559-6) TaxID=578456 RepID=UPI00032BCAEA|nr:uncharacterized protein TREMEDRAFT_65902 [Tremella mesenterica DSM 1558]EIW66058.1 hypothetical protein TREMEDRAFT_65902 [Tremella mesenterica DSM 1558]
MSMPTQSQADQENVQRTLKVLRYYNDSSESQFWFSHQLPPWSDQRLFLTAEQYWNSFQDPALREQSKLFHDLNGNCSLIGIIHDTIQACLNVAARLSQQKQDWANADNTGKNLAIKVVRSRGDRLRKRLKDNFGASSWGEGAYNVALSLVSIVHIPFRERLKGYHFILDLSTFPDTRYSILPELKTTAKSVSKGANSTNSLVVPPRGERSRKKKTASHPYKAADRTASRSSNGSCSEWSTNLTNSTSSYGEHLPSAHRSKTSHAATSSHFSLVSDSPDTPLTSIPPQINVGEGQLATLFPTTSTDYLPTPVMNSRSSRSLFEAFTYVFTPVPKT